MFEKIILEPFHGDAYVEKWKGGNEYLYSHGRLTAIFYADSGEVEYIPGAYDRSQSTEQHINKWLAQLGQTPTKYIINNDGGYDNEEK